jgi:hypothetical protein
MIFGDYDDHHVWHERDWWLVITMIGCRPIIMNGWSTTKSTSIKAVDPVLEPVGEHAF